jgi:hypothetical protein
MVGVGADVGVDTSDLGWAAGDGWVWICYEDMGPKRRPMAIASVWCSPDPLCTPSSRPLVGSVGFKEVDVQEHISLVAKL